MMVFARGLAKTVSGGMKISTAIINANGTYRQVDVPGIFRVIDSRILGGHVSVVTLIFVICAIVSWIVLSRHFLGRQLYAIGGNEEAARRKSRNAVVRGDIRERADADYLRCHDARRWSC